MTGAGRALADGQHTTVLRAETLAWLAPRPGGRYADVTLGRGGHAEAILEASAPDGRLLAVDRDPAAIEAGRRRLAPHGDRVTFVAGAFGALPEHLEATGFGALDGLVADLGVSSPQLDEAERGFSFSADGPLDMRMDPTSGESARELLDRLDETELETILRDFGEERRARGVARSILRARDEGALETTGELRRAVHRASGPRRQRIDPATRTFQAIRIAVNDELGELDALLASLPTVLVPGGVAVILSFHSLEDRRVKWFFRREAALEPLTKKPVVAGDEERAANPRSRSAKLRAARRVSVPGGPS